MRMHQLARRSSRYHKCSGFVQLNPVCAEPVQKWQRFTEKPTLDVIVPSALSK